MRLGTGLSGSLDVVKGSTQDEVHLYLVISFCYKSTPNCFYHLLTGIGDVHEPDQVSGIPSGEMRPGSVDL